MFLGIGETTVALQALVPLVEQVFHFQVRHLAESIIERTLQVGTNLLVIAVSTAHQAR